MTETPAVQTCALLLLPDPRVKLWGLLDTWARVDEAAWLEANVKALFDKIMDIFQEHPEAENWFKTWRAAHPWAKLA